MNERPVLDEIKMPTNDREWVSFLAERQLDFAQPLSGNTRILIKVAQGA